MKAPIFNSAFAQDLTLYLEFKASMGIYCNHRIWYLKDFDTYCQRMGKQIFDRATVEGWVIYRQTATPSVYRSWMSYIRDFGRWLRINGHQSAYVLTDEWKANHIRPKPYLFSQSEVCLFFQTAALLEPKLPWQWQATSIFALMHSCGLRTCEVQALKTGNVNFTKRFIDIHSAKTRRSRRLPLTGQLIEVLAQCDLTTGRKFRKNRQPFFISSKGAALNRNSVADAFNRIWDQGKLSRSKAKKRPRPYDFRHYFAYANIERWMRQGSDVTAMIPYLARYMGHASLASTYYYIHTSPDFMQEYGDITNRSQLLLPKVGFE